MVVNYRNWELTRRCVESLFASREVDLRIFLVDNESIDAPPGWTADRPGLRLLRLKENTGFSGGNNAGFRMSEGDPAPYTFFLNNDAEVLPDTVRLLVDLLERRENAAISCPAIFLASSPDMVWAAGGRFQPSRMKYLQRRYRTREELPRSEELTDFASGCALMIRSPLFSEQRGFREDFFMYYEDAALCSSLTDGGHTIWLEPAATVLHHVGAAGGGHRSSLAVYFSERNRVLLSRDVLSPGMRTVFLLYMAAVLPLKTVKFLFSGESRLIPWTWKGLVHGLQGKAAGRREATDLLS